MNDVSHYLSGHAGRSPNQATVCWPCHAGWLVHSEISQAVESERCNWAKHSIGYRASTEKAIKSIEVLGVGLVLHGADRPS